MGAPRRRPAGPAWLAVAALAFASACGSTVQSTGAGTPGGFPGGEDSTAVASDGMSVAGDGLTAPGPGVPAELAAPGQVTSGGITGGARTAAPAGSGVAPGQPVAGGRPGTASAPTAQKTYRGATATTISLGVMVATGNSKAAKSAGFDVDTGDVVAQVRAMQAWVNAHGGMGGRRVSIVFHDRDDSPGQTNEAKSQAACEAFTQDSTVYAVMTFFTGAGVAPCLAKKDTAMIDTSVIAFLDDAGFRRLGPYYFSPTTININRYVEELVTGLARQRFFGDPKSKFGLVYGDTPASRSAVKNSLEPAMAELGVKLTGKAAVTPATTPEGAASQSREVQNAILQFRADGVTHVMFLYPACACLFMIAAEGQDYRPRYGLGTYDSPSTTQDLVPHAQLQGAVGVGFMPAGDVVAAQQDRPVSDQETLCLKIMKDAGMAASSQATRIGMLAHCEMFLFTKRVLDAAVDISPAGFARTAESVGAGYSSTLTFRTRITPSQHDGPAALRPFAFNSSCGCFRYTGPAYAAG